MPDLSSRAQALQPSAILAAGDAARDVTAQPLIDLAEGDPWQDSPAIITDAAVAALKSGETHYVAAQGIPELRHAILDADPRLAALGLDDVLVTPGAKFALFVLVMCLLNPGDGAIVIDPAWVSYDPMIRLAGGEPIRVGTTAQNRYFPLMEDLERAAPKAKLIMLNSPNNPTGRVYTHDELEQILEFAKRHNLWVISDEIYDRMTFEGSFPSVLDFPAHADRIILVNGFSKSFAMTGWRVGYFAAPAPLAAAALRFLQHSQTCVAPFAQLAAAQALTSVGIAEAAAIRDDLKARRDLVDSTLGELPGLRLHPVEGGFFTWIDVSDIEPDSTRFASALRAKGVSITAGSAFGACGEGHIRLSFVRGTREELAEGLQRIADLTTSYEGN